MVNERRLMALLRWMSAGGESTDLAELERSSGTTLECLLEEKVQGSPRLAAAASDAARRRAEEWIHVAAARGMCILGCEEVPEFAALPQPPLLVFLRGQLGRSPRLSVVGARAASHHGLRNTRRICGAVAAAGVPIVSGLARGIDAAAHAAALDSGGMTVAVLGSGLDECYPPEHAALLERIIESGAAVSEWPPGTPPLPHHFPRRNRLLVALGKALLLVESRLRSGSFTSVRWAADLGREMLVLPGPADAPQSEGPVQLLREGATAVTEAEHVLEALGVAAGAPAASVPDEAPSFSAVQQRLLGILGAEALDLDALVRVSCEPPGSVLAAVLGLELVGAVQRDDWGAFSVCRRSEQGAVVDAEIQHEMQCDGGRNEDQEALQSVAEPDAQRGAEIVPARHAGDEVHHDEERQEEHE